MTAIKFKAKENIKVQVDWNTIGENMETYDLFNINLFQITPKEPTCTLFNQCINKVD